MNHFPLFYYGAKNVKFKITKKLPLDPIGITIHYSADRDSNRVINWLEEEYLGYHLLIERNGDVLQLCPFNERVNHAGKALWNGKSPNKHHIAICIMSWGIVRKSQEKYFNWNSQEIPRDQVAKRNNAYWDFATIDQENSLKLIIKWMIENGIDPHNICGHNECCIPIGRKIDPGKVLSFSIESIRQSNG